MELQLGHPVHIRRGWDYLKSAEYSLQRPRPMVLGSWFSYGWESGDTRGYAFDKTTCVLARVSTGRALMVV